MTVLTFPSSPIEGQVYAAPNGVRYVYDGVKWGVETLTSSSEAVTNSTQDRVAPMFVDGTHDGITFMYDAGTNVMSATVTAVNSNTLVNGGKEVVLGADGTLTLSNTQTIDASDANLLQIGTVDAGLRLNSLNQSALLIAKKTFNREFFNDNVDYTITATAGSEGIPHIVTVTFSPNVGLYFRQLLTRLEEKLLLGSTAFIWDYSNVQINLNPNDQAVVANITTLTQTNSAPWTYEITIDQDPTAVVGSITDIIISYDYNNTIGLDVTEDRFGIATDDDDIDLRSGRDIDLIAADDILLTAGSTLEIILNQNDGSPDDTGLQLRTSNNNGNKNWTFRFDGNLELPSGGVISETEITGNSTIVITPALADSPNQGLYIKGGVAPGDFHLHLTTGDLSDTSIILGTDDHNVRTTVDGGVEINTFLYPSGGGSGRWKFDAGGILTFPGVSTYTIGEDEPGLAIRSEFGFAVLTNVTSNTYEVEFIGYVSNGFGDASGATLTVTEIVAGTITNGMTIYGAGLPPEGWVLTFDGGLLPPVGSGGTGNYLLSGANILTSSQSFNNNVLAAGSNAWVFENNGNVTFPNGGVIRVDGDNLEVGSVTNFNIETSGVANVYTNNGAYQWQFGDDGTLTFPDATAQTTAYIAPTTGNAVINSQDPGTAITRNGMTIGITADGILQMTFDSVINIKGRVAINGGASTVIPGPNGDTTIGVAYPISSAVAADDHVVVTIVDSSFHKVYRVTAIIREQGTTPGSEFTTAYAIIEQLQ